MLNNFILTQLNTYAATLEEKLKGDVLYYYGLTHPWFIKPFRNLIEKMASNDNKRDTICIFLNTSGGAVEPVEKMVDIIRYHYDKVYFFVPDFAMSAGTIFCTSGDKIFMDYSSSLGPIDPQVMINDNGVEKWVPALGVLEQVEKLIAKSKDNTISPAEFSILQSQNLAILSSYEHARDLSIDLATKWLIKYRFNQGTQQADAEEIVKKLIDHNKWHSHGRFIGIETLREIGLKIDDYPNEATVLIRAYNDLITDFVQQNRYTCYMHDKQKITEG